MGQKNNRNMEGNKKDKMSSLICRATKIGENVDFVP